MNNKKYVYKKETIQLLDGTKIELSPLKLLYLKELMDTFDEIKQANDEDAVVTVLTDCVRVAMKQFYPEIDSIESVQDRMDMKTLYKILEIGADLSLDPTKKKPVSEQVEEESKKPKASNKKGESITWDNLNLVEYESQAFLLGMWKNFEELESSISLIELTEILSAANEKNHADKKFFAAIQGIDIDGKNGGGEDSEDPWEAMKSRVAAKTSGIKPVNSNDIVSYNGVKAKQAGFGIGMGLDYERLD
jgi:hypothetical protein